MTASIHALTIPAAMTRPAFWLYVWRVTTDTDDELLYVGRTGDSTYTTANPPIFRMGQHFEPKGGGNMLLQRLADREIDPYTCTDFQIVAHGPLFPAANNKPCHYKRRDIVAALERALRDALLLGGYDVISHENSIKPLCQPCWQDIRQAFQRHFDQIAPYPHETQRPNYVCYKHA